MRLPEHRVWARDSVMACLSLLSIAAGCTRTGPGEVNRSVGACLLSVQGLTDEERWGLYGGVPLVVAGTVQAVVAEPACWSQELQIGGPPFDDVVQGGVEVLADDGRVWAFGTALPGPMRYPERGANVRIDYHQESPDGHGYLVLSEGGGPVFWYVSWWSASDAPLPDSWSAWTGHPVDSYRSECGRWRTTSVTFQSGGASLNLAPGSEAQQDETTIALGESFEIDTWRWRCQDGVGPSFRAALHGTL